MRRAAALFPALIAVLAIAACGDDDSSRAEAPAGKGRMIVLLVHSPRAEEEFIDGGHGSSRRAVMHNDFIVLGPAGAPAGVKRASSAAEAFGRIAKAEAPFASRADESGTNTKELSLWEAAGVEPRGSWYIETGQGMGATLTIAGQKQAYTLADRGTFLAMDNLDLELLLEGGKDLLNPYHAIVVNGDSVNRACAQEFCDWIVSSQTQREIGRFGVLDSPASVVQRPADATVAKLVGYENVLPVQVDQSAQVLIGGAPCGVATTAGPGRATLAAWGTAIRVLPPDTAPLRATVERVSQGPGRWDVTLTAGETLHAHLPLDRRPPGVSECVGVQVDWAHATLIARHRAA